MNNETTLHSVNSPVGELNLATQNQEDYTVYADGSAYISQRKAAELLGVKSSTVMMHISREHAGTATGLGLDPKTLQMASTYFAYDSSVKSEKARALCARMMEAGAKAFMYHEAGYQMVAAKPLTRLELAKLQVVLIEELEGLRDEVRVLEVKLDESMEWATIKKLEHLSGDKFDWRVLKKVGISLGSERKDVFDANYGTVKSYHRDTWMLAYDVAQYFTE